VGRNGNEMTSDDILKMITEAYRLISELQGYVEDPDGFDTICKEARKWLNKYNTINIPITEKEVCKADFDEAIEKLHQASMYVVGENDDVYEEIDDFLKRMDKKGIKYV
jgi:hypothetical protein